MEISPIVEGLVGLVKEGEEVTNDFGIENWSSKAASFLNTALSTEHAKEFWRLQAEDSWHQISMRIGHLQGLIAKMSVQSSTSPQVTPSALPDVLQVPSGNKVFVVHGHDGEAKEKVARFLERLELDPVILHEQPNSGRTIIEKFETYSGGTAFSVVLLTPDDVGHAQNAASNIQPRARQNVILELGYFLGKLGRGRVCALYKAGVELPSDIQGVLYVEMDKAGAWKTKLAQEFVEAKLPINLNGLVGG